MTRKLPRFTPATRPYWFVDLKWVFGIVLLVTLTLALATQALVHVTNPVNGPRVSALFIGSLMIQEEDADELQQNAKKALAANDGVIRPIPSMPEITITEEDLDLSHEELKLKVFSPLTTAVYEDGVTGAADEVAKTQKQRDEFINDAALLNIFTRDIHERLQQVRTVMFIVAGVALLAVAYFSARWGRVANPGFVLVFASFAGSFVGFIFRNPRVENPEASGPIPRDIMPYIGEALRPYEVVFVVGVSLLVIALLGWIATLVAKHAHRIPSPLKKGDSST